MIFVFDFGQGSKELKKNEIKISVLIDVDKVEEAVVSIHEQFRMYEKK